MVETKGGKEGAGQGKKGTGRRYSVRPYGRGNIKREESKGFVLCCFIFFVRGMLIYSIKSSFRCPAREGENPGDLSGSVHIETSGANARSRRPPGVLLTHATEFEV